MSDASFERSRQEAMVWRIRFDATRITKATLRAFAAWRRRPENEAAFGQVEREAQARAARIR